MYANSAASQARIKSKLPSKAIQKAMHLIQLNALNKYITHGRLCKDIYTLVKVACNGSNSVSHQAREI
jgi:hypothetical protein